MAKFVEFTSEADSPISINVDLLMSYAPLGGDLKRGVALQFAFSTGDNAATRLVRVKETYAQVTAKLSTTASKR